MNEFNASSRLSDYIDGELSPAEAAEVERSLLQNPELRQELERLQATIGFLREHGPVDAPPGFHARVMEAVADEPLPGGLWVRLRRFFTAVPMETLAVAVAAVLVAVVIGQRMDPETPAFNEVVDQGEQGEAGQAAAVGEQEATGGQAEKMESAAQAAAELLTQGSASAQKETRPERQVATYEGARTSKETPVGAGGSEDLDTRKESSPVVEDVAELSTGSGDPVATTSVGAVSDAIALQAALSYRLHTDDPKALRLLQGIVSRHGGVIVDSAGKPLDTSTALGSTGERQSLVVIIDPARIPGFARDLDSMGEVESLSTDSTQLVGAAETMRISLDLMYEP